MADNLRGDENGRREAGRSAIVEELYQDSMLRLVKSTDDELVFASRSFNRIYGVC